MNPEIIPKAELEAAQHFTMFYVPSKMRNKKQKRLLIFTSPDKSTSIEFYHNPDDDTFYCKDCINVRPCVAVRLIKDPENPRKKKIKFVTEEDEEESGSEEDEQEEKQRQTGKELIRKSTRKRVRNPRAAETNIAEGPSRKRKGRSRVGVLEEVQEEDENGNLRRSTRKRVNNPRLDDDTFTQKPRSTQKSKDVSAKAKRNGQALNISSNGKDLIASLSQSRKRSTAELNDSSSSPKKPRLEIIDAENYELVQVPLARRLSRRLRLYTSAARQEYYEFYHNKTLDYYQCKGCHSLQRRVVFMRLFQDEEDGKMKFCLGTKEHICAPFKVLEQDVAVELKEEEPSDSHAVEHVAASVSSSQSQNASIIIKKELLVFENFLLEDGTERRRLNISDPRYGNRPFAYFFEDDGSYWFCKECEERGEMVIGVMDDETGGFKLSEENTHTYDDLDNLVKQLKDDMMEITMYGKDPETRSKELRVALKEFSNAIVQNCKNLPQTSFSTNEKANEIKEKLQTTVKPLFENILEITNPIDLLSLSETGRIGSSIVTKIEDIKLLRSWIEAKGLVKFKLIYKGSKDGFTGDAFHKKCDEFKPTITIVKSHNNKVFGGYSDVTWGGPNNYKNTANSWLFSLDHKEKYKQKPNQSHYGVYCYSSYGPTFGGGHDIYIANNSNTGNSCYSNFGYTFESKNVAYSTTQAQSHLAGSYNFKVEEIEVFHILTGSGN